MVNLIPGLPTISILLKIIIEKYLNQSYCLAFVSEEAIEFEFQKNFMYLKPNGSVEDLTEKLLVISESGCSDYIVNMENPKVFMMAVDKVSRLGIVRRSSRKIIIIPHSDRENCCDEYLGLLRMKSTNYVANILLIIPHKSEDPANKLYDLVTHIFSGTDDNKDLPLYLDQWDTSAERFIKNYNLFPHDMANLNGRTLRVACFTYKPYVLLDLDTNLVPSGMDGMELRIVVEFCRWVNCTIEIVRADDDQWGEIYENGTGVGVLGSVVEDEADMGISALYSWYEEYLYLDFSAAAIRSGITCVAPAPRRLSSWEMPLLPFTWYMWYAVIITYVLASLGLIIAKRGVTNGVFLTIFGLMIGQSQNNIRRTWRIRIVTGWLLLATLILVSAYGGGLASTFTVPKYEPSIDTVEDLVDRHMEWGATHDAWIFSLTLSNEPLIKTLVSQFRIHSEKELEDKSFTRDFAFSIEKLPAGYFAIGDYLTKEALLDLTLMLEDFYYEQCVVMLKKSSPYTEKISELIGRLHQSGLMLAWETQVALNHLNFKVQQEVKLSRTKTDSDQTDPLNFHDVMGIYVVYVAGVVISILTFLFELMSKPKYNK